MTLGDASINAVQAKDLPLGGVRVLELGHYVAAPFATRVLADLGAEVIKIEPPRIGDPVRQWGEQQNGRSVWWSVHGRNKKCVTLNIKHPEARPIIEGLIRACDVVIENFRAGHLDRMGYGDDYFRAIKPEIVICHVSGYGQDGPHRNRSSFGVIGEAIGGLRYLTNNPEGTNDLPPVRVGVSIGDSISGLYAAIGILAALLERRPCGRSIDVALTESVLSLLEGALPEYGMFGNIRKPMGGRIPTASPSNAFRTADGGWFIIAANSDQLFERLCGLMGRPELSGDLRFATNQSRCSNSAALEEIITNWSSSLSLTALEQLLLEKDIPGCRVFNVADIAADSQYLFRRMVQEVDDPLLGPVLHPGSVPHFVGSDRRVRWTGPEVGAHNSEIYGQMLGIEETALEGLIDEGVI